MIKGQNCLRIAPAPSGYLHLGSLYVFYFNYLLFLKLSKVSDCKLFLRIDDTNNKLISQDNIINIINDLKLFGILYNDIFFQSKRNDIYYNKALELINKKKAYICNCPEKRINILKSKLKNKYKYDRYCYKKNNNFIFNKSVIRIYNENRDDINSDFYNIDDFIIIRSNKKAISVFAGAIDDIDYNITYVVRGQDWILSTKKQILIFNFFQKHIPKYIHLNLIRNIDNSKLSKRNKDLSIYNMIKIQGYFTSAIKNWFLLIGYKRKGKLFSDKNKEFFNIKEIEENFDINNIKNQFPKYDINKLKWLNKIHMINKSNKEIYNFIMDMKINHNNIKKRNEYIWLFFINRLKKHKKIVIDIIKEIEILFLNCQTHFLLFKKYIEEKNIIYDKKQLNDILLLLDINKKNNKKINSFVIFESKNHLEYNYLDINILFKYISIFRKIIFLNNYSFSNIIFEDMYNNNIFINKEYIIKCISFLINI